MRKSYCTNKELFQEKNKKKPHIKLQESYLIFVFWKQVEKTNISDSPENTGPD